MKQIVLLDVPLPEQILHKTHHNASYLGSRARNNRVRLASTGWWARARHGMAPAAISGGPAGGTSRDRRPVTSRGGSRGGSGRAAARAIDVSSYNLIARARRAGEHVRRCALQAGR
jgi:hypothetical protein